MGSATGASSLGRAARAGDLVSLRDVDAAYLAGFRDGANCARAKAAAADSAVADNAAGVHVKPFVTKSNAHGYHDYAGSLRHLPTMPPHEAA